MKKGENNRKLQVHQYPEVTEGSTTFEFQKPEWKLLIEQIGHTVYTPESLKLGPKNS